MRECVSTAGAWRKPRLGAAGWAGEKQLREAPPAKKQNISTLNTGEEKETSELGESITLFTVSELLVKRIWHLNHFEL